MQIQIDNQDQLTQTINLFAVQHRLELPAGLSGFITSWAMMGQLEAVQITNTNHEGSPWVMLSMFAGEGNVLTAPVQDLDVRALDKLVFSKALEAGWGNGGNDPKFSATMLPKMLLIVAE